MQCDPKIASPSISTWTTKSAPLKERPVMPAKNVQRHRPLQRLVKGQVFFFVLDTTKNHIRHASDISIENNGISFGPVQPLNQLDSQRRSFMTCNLTYRASRHPLVLVSVYILVIFIVSHSFLSTSRDPGALTHPLAGVLVLASSLSSFVIPKDTRLSAEPPVLRTLPFVNDHLNRLSDGGAH
jgi:hypothetical protein